MKRKICLLFAVFFIFSLLISLLGCGQRLSEDGAEALVLTLVRESYMLNEIYFGKGLSYEDDGDNESLYSPVSQAESFTKKSQLIEKTLSVFSEEYAMSIIDMAFNGASGAAGGGVYARYMVYTGEELYVKENIDGIEINEYDYTYIKIEKISKRFIEAEMMTTKGDKVKITLVEQNGQYRLDSATY